MTTARKSLPALIWGRLALGTIATEGDYWEPSGALKFSTKPAVRKPEPAEKVQRSAAIEDWRACAR
jgi:hypothetical protein